jgi:hypothetical protein
LSHRPSSTSTSSARSPIPNLGFDTTCWLCPGTTQTHAYQRSWKEVEEAQQTLFLAMNIAAMNSHVSWLFNSLDLTKKTWTIGLLIYNTCHRARPCRPSHHDSHDSHSNTVSHMLIRITQLSPCRSASCTPDTTKTTWTLSYKQYKQNSRTHTT